VIGGDPHQGEVLTVSSSWNPAGSSYAYQWQHSTDGSTWAAISGATGSSYTLGVADEGATIDVVVTASDAYGQVPATSAAVGPVHSNPPVNTTAPLLAGTTQRTYTLTATQGSWNGPGNSYYYQWQRSPDGVTWTNIAGATASTYALAVGDEGDDVHVLVTASNLDGVYTQASNATTQIIAPFPPANVTPPTISGTAQRSSILSATLGAWTGPGNVYSYQWQRDWGEGYVAISGATSSAYTLGVADEGSTVRVLVTAANPDATIVEASQPTTTVLSAIPVNNSVPTVTGTVARSFTLTASQGSWGGVGNAYSYQWQDSLDGNTWASIHNATAATYTLGVGDESTQLRVVVTASNVDGPVSANSTPTVMVPTSPPLSATPPIISGTAQRTVTLTSTLGAWSGIGNSYAYQWLRSVDGGVTWTSIGGATSSAYTLAFVDEGATVRMSVTATNPDGNISAASAPTATVQGALPVNLTVPTISGVAQRTVTLTSTQGSWGGLGNSYAYQWQRSTDAGSTWTSIAGAIGSTYTLAVADEGATVHVLVTATNADGNIPIPSAATWTVPPSPPANTTPPTISGAAQRGTRSPSPTRALGSEC
jgi:hypothetical protein